MPEALRSFMKQHQLTPSKLIRHMADGLRSTKDDDTAEVHMLSWGGRRDDVCCGCAATWSLVNITGRRPQSSFSAIRHDRARDYNMDIEVLEAIEHGINSLREGRCSALASLFNETLPEPASILPYMNSADWETQLPAYEKYAEQLEEAGF